MLIEFEVENFGPVRDGAVLSMLASEESGTRRDTIADCDYRMVGIAGIYGANGSGKSSVIAALRTLSELVARSGTTFPDEPLPDLGFRFSTERRPTLFTVSFTNGVAFEYRLGIFDGKVSEERLTDLSTDTVIFDRRGQDFILGDFSESDRMMGEIVRMTDCNNLFLSRCVQFRIGRTMPAGQWLQECVLWSEPGSIPVQELEGMRAEAIDMLDGADLGISDIVFGKSTDRHGRRRPPRLEHRILSEDAPEDRTLPLDMESEGTIALLSMIPALKESLDEGKLLIVDNLERGLHPLLVDHLLGMFMDAWNGAQILFTSHDPGIPARNGLHPDQIWFTSRDPLDGRTHLYPLTDFEIDEKYDFERDYLEGRMGGVPYIPMIVRGGD